MYMVNEQFWLVIFSNIFMNLNLLFKWYFFSKIKRVVFTIKQLVQFICVLNKQ